MFDLGRVAVPFSAEQLFVVADRMNTWPALTLHEIMNEAEFKLSESGETLQRVCHQLALMPLVPNHLCPLYLYLLYLLCFCLPSLKPCLRLA